MTKLYIVTVLIADLFFSLLNIAIFKMCEIQLVLLYGYYIFLIFLQQESNFWKMLKHIWCRCYKRKVNWYLFNRWVPWIDGFVVQALQKLKDDANPGINFNDGRSSKASTSYIYIYSVIILNLLLLL